MYSILTLWLISAIWPPNGGLQTPIKFIPAEQAPTTTASPRSNLPTLPAASIPCLSGIINSYTPVQGFGCDSSALQVGPTAGFAVGSKVLLIQMQVPQVDLSNTANFGGLLSNTCIGNYELNRIQSINGNLIQLQFALTRPYDLSGKVQLVTVPEYDSATVCDVTCLPWNGEVGGVLALDVKGQMTLNANINVTGRGFRGGQVETDNIPWLFGEQQFTYPPMSVFAAQKGEGIVQIPIDFSFGRGRAGNGGGGGNAHNGGGGGGGNAGAGGSGGLEMTIPPFPATPNTSGIGGQRYFENQSNKILLGGGGGAGHANDMLGSSGGNGGGIVLLLANSLITNNFRVLANGVDVFGGQEWNDGQGGGGGGGTILLQVGQVVGTLNCELRGGRGGSNPYTPDNQVHGPGGGGGGGKLLLTQNSPNIVAALQGGVNGLSSLNLTNGATTGAVGRMIAGFSIPTGTLPARPVSDLMQIAVQVPPCSGTSNGQIVILQSSALAFSLNGGPWQSDSVFSNLPPGQHQISLQFSGACTYDTLALLVAAPPVQDTLLSLVAASCVLGGSISINAVSGTAPFQFQIDGGPWQPNGDFSGLPQGVHTILMRDANGCLLSSEHVITGPPVLLDSLTSLVNATCVIGGEIGISAVSGTAPFQYQINGGAWQMNGVFADLPAGAYTVGLLDAAGCTHSNEYVVETAPSVQDTLISMGIETCVSGGEIVVNAVSGTAPFQYQLNGGAWQPSGTFSNLAAGTYTVGLLDAAGCTLSSDYVVESAPPVQVLLESQSIETCLSGGEIVVSAISGTAPFQYQINGGAWQPGGIFADLPAGAYTVGLLDAAGCTISSNYVVESAPPVQVLLESLSIETCVSGGGIVVSAVSGTAPFQYQLNGGAWQPSGTFFNLAAGTYTVGLLDAAGCAFFSDYVVESAPPVQVLLESLSIETCVSGGEIVVSAVSGTAPFQYQVNGGPWQPDGVFSSLSAGTYTLGLLDAAGCTDYTDFVVAASPLVQDTLEQLSIASCVVGGEIVVTAVSGTAPFQFQINGGPWQASGAFADLPAGAYTIGLLDAAGCTHSSMYIVDGPATPQLSLQNLVGATCVAGGEIAVTAGEGAAPYEFQINGSAWQSSGVFPNLPAGAYTITMRDAAGCASSNEYVVAAPTPLLGTLVSSIAATCVSGGSFTYAAVSGTAPFQYQLNGGAGQQGGGFSNLPAGNYALLLSDASGCTITATVTIQAPPVPVVAIVALSNADCFEQGAVQVGAVSGTAPFEFQLNGGAWQSNAEFTGLTAGVYQVGMLDAAGCIHSIGFQIQEIAPLRLQLDSLSHIDCRHPTGYISVSASGGAGGYTFVLNDGTAANVDGQFFGLHSDEFEVRVADALGCETSLGDLQVLNFIESVRTAETVTIYEGTYFRLPDGRSVGKAGDYLFHNQTVEGCDSLHVIHLLVLKRNIYIPNVFLPGDDGSNNFFTVFADESLDLVQYLEIYDRWGELVFRNDHFLPNAAQNGWDGRYRGRVVNPGVFVWMAKLKFRDGLEMSLSGDVTVLH